MPARNVTFGLIEVVAALVPFGTPSHRGECGWGVANLIKRLCFRAPRCFSGRKQAANPVVRRLRCIWLWERVSVTQFLRGIDSARYGARQHHVQTRAMLANPFCQSKPVHRTWHLNVTENYVNIGFSSTRTAIASSAFAASITRYPQSRRYWAIGMRIKTSSLTTRTISWETFTLF